MDLIAFFAVGVEYLVHLALMMGEYLIQFPRNYIIISKHMDAQRTEKENGDKYIGI